MSAFVIVAVPPAFTTTPYQVPLDGERVTWLPAPLVASLANATDITSRDGDLWVDAFYDEPPTDPAALATLRERVMAHPVYGNALVARDGRAAAFVVFFEHIDERDFVARDVGNHLAAVASEEAGAPVQVTGNPAAERTLDAFKDRAIDCTPEHAKVVREAYGAIGEYLDEHAGEHHGGAANDRGDDSNPGLRCDNRLHRNTDGFRAEGG